MAGEQKRKDRQVLVTKALLLGYTFERSERGYELIKPDGMAHYIWKHRGGMSHGPITVYYPALHLAAIEALKHAGVYDATNPPKDLGVGSGKSFRLRGQRRIRGGLDRFLESAWPRQK